MGLPVLLTAYGPDGALPPIIATLCLTLLFITGAEPFDPGSLSVAISSIDPKQSSLTPPHRTAAQSAQN